jgi:hypothetical protein
VIVRKVKGSENPADILTKFLGQEPVQRIAMQLGIELVWRHVAERARAEEG